MYVGNQADSFCGRMKMPKPSKSPTEMYEEVFPTYQAFSTKLKTLLVDLLDASEIKYQIVEARAKDVSSFADKIKRPGKSYKDPLKDITDLCGCRVIVYYADDVEKVANIIKNEFKIVEENLTRQPDVLENDRFGYLSAHYLVSMIDARSVLLEWALFKELVAEIQIRTVIQHAWSAVSHALQYKQEASVPSKLQRRLFRIAGLFELADEEFVAIRSIREKATLEVRQNIKQSLQGVALSPTSLTEFIKTWDGLPALRDATQAAGFTNNNDDDEYAEISVIYDLSVLGGISDLDELAKVLKETPHEFFSRLIQENEGWETSDDFNIVLCLVYYNRNKLTEKFLEKRGFNDEIAKTVLLAAKS